MPTFDDNVQQLAWITNKHDSIVWQNWADGQIVGQYRAPEPMVHGYRLIGFSPSGEHLVFNGINEAGEHHLFIAPRPGTETIVASG